MKKSLVLCVLALSLTSCDLSSFIKVSRTMETFEETGEHEGITLVVEGNEQLLLKEKEKSEYVNRSTITSIRAGSSTIKRLDGQITFYQYPVYGKAQLDEVDDKNNNDRFYYEQLIDFSAAEKQNFDFIYLTSVSFESNNPNHKLYKFLRIALMDKETNSDYYVFSRDKDGIVSKTEYNLDLDANGELDKEQKNYGFDNDDPTLINYTTGMPSYMTDSYEMSIPTQNELEQDNIPGLKALIPFNKALTIRIWFEGWELENTDDFSDLNIDIGIKFAGHEAK